MESSNKNTRIENYMAIHRRDANAIHEWEWFVKVMQWWESNFIEYRPEMKGWPYGKWYNVYKNKKFKPKEVEKRIKALIQDEELEDTSMKGVYEYILSDDERYLVIRQFSIKEKHILFEKAKHCCAECEKKFAFKDVEADHIIPWSKGGKTTLDNGQILCISCNRKKKAQHCVSLENKKELTGGEAILAESAILNE